MPHKLVGPDTWETYPRRAFAAWYNQLEGLRSPVLVATRSADGVDNVAVFSSLTHVGARPPLVGLTFRPLTVERDTYDNLRQTGTFTVNHLPQEHLRAAHATSVKAGRGVSEFDLVGLHPLDSGLGAPYVAEASVSLACTFAEEHFIAANDTVFVVGAVRELRLPEAAAFGATRVDWEALGATVVSGLYQYYRVRFDTEEGYVTRVGE